MKAKKKRMLKIFIATDIFFSHCLPVNQDLKSNSEKRLIKDGENGKCTEHDRCDFETYPFIHFRPTCQIIYPGTKIINPLVVAILVILREKTP